MKHYWVSLCLALVAGCTGVFYRNQADWFRAKHSDLAQEYSLLAPVSVEYIEYIRPDEQVPIDGVIHNLERVKTNSAHLDRYLQYLTCVQAAVETDRAQWLSLTNRIRKTDSMYFFKYKKPVGDAYYDDFGMLVLRDGDIVYRSRWGWGFTGSPEAVSNAIEPPEMTMDRLQQGAARNSRRAGQLTAP
jgi:hypothetical protein